MNIHSSAKQFTEAMTHTGFAACNEDPRYEVPGCSGICTEVEMLALLFGFVRALRPKVVVETGCNVGCATLTLRSALEANGENGVLHTCDTDSSVVNLAMAHVIDINHSATIWLHDKDGLWLIQQVPNADLYFIDSSVESRMGELDYLHVHGKPGATVLVHDTTLYLSVRQLVETFPRHVVLPGPRGLGVITL